LTCGEKQLQASGEKKEPTEWAQPSKNGGDRQVGTPDKPKRGEKKEG
jgi:hypothetical protein